MHWAAPPSAPNGIPQGLRQGLFCSQLPAASSTAACHAALQLALPFLRALMQFPQHVRCAARQAEGARRRLAAQLQAVSALAGLALALLAALELPRALALLVTMAAAALPAGVGLQRWARPGAAAGLRRWAGAWAAWACHMLEAGAALPQRGVGGGGAAPPHEQQVPPRAEVRRHAHTCVSHHAMMCLVAGATFWRLAEH